MSNWSKSNFLQQRDLELWESRDLPNFPPHYPTKCKESSFFLFLLQRFHVLQLHEKSLEAHCNPNVNCCRQFRASCLCTKMVVLWVCTFSEDEMNIPELHHKKTANFLIAFSSASSIFSTRQDILLQKLTDLKMESRRSFT